MENNPTTPEPTTPEPSKLENSTQESSTQESSTQESSKSETFADQKIRQTIGKNLRSVRTLFTLLFRQTKANQKDFSVSATGSVNSVNQNINQDASQLLETNRAWQIFRKYWTVLLWVGLFSITAGGSAGLLTGQWRPVSVMLLILGVVSIVLWLAGLEKFHRNFWAQRSTEAGTNAILSTLAVIGILVAINVLGSRYSARLDLTETKRFTLAPESVASVRQLKEPLKIWVFSLQPNPKDEALLKNYVRKGEGNVSYEYVDPQANLGLAQEFGVTSLAGEVYLEAGKTKETAQRQFVQTLDVEGLSETKLSNKIAQLGAGVASKLYFLQGHGERSITDAQQGGLSRAIKSLEEKNYAIVPLNLTDSGVPEDAAAIVILSPESKLFDPEIQAISDYLKKGGRVFLTIDPNTESGLEKFVNEWGIELGKGIAIDPEQWVQGLGPAAPLVIDYGQHPITAKFKQNFSIFPVANPIKLKEQAGIIAQPILFTSNASWEETNLKESPNWTKTEGEDSPGPLVLGAALSKTVTKPKTTDDGTSQATEKSEKSVETEATELENATDRTQKTEDSDPSDLAPSDPSKPEDGQAQNQPENKAENQTEQRASNQAEARLVMIGDSDFLTDSFFDSQLNGDLFLNSIGWLSEANEAELSIRAKEDTNRSLTLTPATARFLAWTALATFPAIGFGASAMLWWSRR